MKNKIIVKNINPIKRMMVTRVKFSNQKLGSWNRDHPIEKKYGVQLPINLMLKDVIEKKKQLYKKIQNKEKTIKRIRTRL
jgi:hypothetical protein